MAFRRDASPCFETPNKRQLTISFFIRMQRRQIPSERMKRCEYEGWGMNRANKHSRHTQRTRTRTACCMEKRA